MIYRDAPSLDGLKTAAVGYVADGAQLVEALAQARAEGFEAVIGPMEGSTWGRHRLVVESDGRPPFLMEPTNPEGCLEAFEASGLGVVARYVSAERGVDAPTSGTPPPAGLRLRPFEPAHAERDLTALHTLSLETFANNRFYKPIALEPFLASYRPVLPMLDPDLVLMAEDEAGTLRAFLFAVADFNEGARPQTVILKTYASAAKGAGSMLANAFHERARAKGFRRVIHALMHEDNLSVRHSARTGGRVFRRYALWGGRL
jgi:L-amino acid N-acyltransferase YncA